MTEPLPSIIIMMILLLIGVVYYVVYIFRMAYAENEVSDSADSNFEHDDSSCTEQETGVVQSGTGEYENISDGANNDSP